MKFVCSKCGAKYFHNSFILPPTKCRFCGGTMVKSKMTAEEFKEFYTNEENNK